MGLLATICVMVESDSARGPDESLPWSLLPEPPGLTALEAAMRDLDEAMQPSSPSYGTYTSQLGRRSCNPGGVGLLGPVERAIWTCQQNV